MVDRWFTNIGGVPMLKKDDIVIIYPSMFGRLAMMGISFNDEINKCLLLK